ncbi:MAG: hypothetical protein MSIBF_00020 [Candidatus Altiarchaeales archaeon IMC4]|nr:MAG: hypothetical protein MSIBF_00020 [Candidatus Altiarchaeales archaeon IMC4]
MEILGFDVLYLLGAIMVFFAAAGVVLSLVGAALVVLFSKRNKLFISRTTLIILRAFEVPIKYLLSLFGMDGDVLDRMLVGIENNLYKNAFSKVPYKKRAIFFPQCLRHPECPAKLSPEGIQCIGCGRCGLGEIKKDAEKLGVMFFIVPGSSFIKRMIRKYKPLAVIGVGCSMEVKEGMQMMAEIGLPTQAVTLLRDGCMDTRVDVDKLMQAIMMPRENDLERTEEIARKWNGR